MDLTDIYRIFHSTIAQYTFLAYGTLSKIYHMLGHKASLNKYNKIEIRPPQDAIRPQWNKTRT
jgi:hypothetical protein